MPTKRRRSSRAVSKSSQPPRKRAKLAKAGTTNSHQPAISSQQAFDAVRSTVDVHKKVASFKSQTDPANPKPTKRRRSSKAVSKSQQPPRKIAKLAKTDTITAGQQVSAAPLPPVKEIVSYKSLPDTLTDPGWRKLLQPLFEADSWQKLVALLDGRLAAGEKIYPPIGSVFRAFNLTPLASVKVVVLGQDPYHGQGQADGLAFSFSGADGNLPPSLKNIFKELQADVAGFVAPGAGSLEKWARQGVLLLNTALTVAEGKPGSHTKLGWTEFTDSVLTQLISAEEVHKNPIVFLLWGKPAQSKARLIAASSSAVILEAAHPSPAACGAFSGCRIFSRANGALVSGGSSPIDWKLL